MTHALDHVLRHNNWATAALLEFCKGLDAGVLSAGAGGTYGSLGGTLGHLVGAQQWYVKLLTGELIGRPIRRTEPPRPLDELASIADETGARLITLAESDDPGRPVEMNEGERSTVGVILAQVVHHANEHRTQATTILGANGIDPPPLSGWGYGRWARLSTAGE